MSAKFDVEYSDIQKLEEKVAQIPKFSEEIVNTALENQGAREVVEGITNLIKVGARSGRHARNSKWEKVKKFNLGFDVIARGGAAKNKGSFGYLVFPNEGRGPRNHVEQQFMERGLDTATPKILDLLNVELDKKIKEVF